MEETKNNVVNNEVDKIASDVHDKLIKGTDVEAKEVKTFTQDEVDKMISKRLQRERKDIEAKIEAERKEAEELAKLSEQEKQKKLFEKQVREFEETKKAFEAERLLNETSKQLASKNLPIEFAEMLKGEDAESTLNNINVFEAKFNEALEKMVTERLRGATPKVATTSNGITKEEFKKMSLAQQAELARKDKDLYLELSKN